MGLGIQVEFGFVSVMFLSPADALCLSNKVFSYCRIYYGDSFKKKLIVIATLFP